MSYRVVWSQRAQKDLGRLDGKTRARIVAKVESIKEHPLDYVKRLTGVPLYSLRIGAYRAILDVSTAQLIMLVVRAGHRGKIYNEV